MKVVVVGATGFLGSNAVSELLRRGEEVVAFSRPGMRAERLSEAGVQVVHGDLTDRRSIMGLALEDVDALLHFGGVTSPGLSVSDESANSADTESSATLFKRAVDAGVGKILFSSSGGTVYGNPEVPSVDEGQPLNPLIPYAHTKVAIESNLREACADSETVPIILRYGNPYGPNQYPARGTGVVTAWLEAARDGAPIHIYGHADSARDFVYVSDATRAAMAAIDAPEANGVYNVGTGRPTDLRTLLDVVQGVVGDQLEVAEHPPRPSDRVSRIALDCTRAKEQLGWSPSTTLEEGVSVTWDWVRSGEPFLLDYPTSS